MKKFSLFLLALICIAAIGIYFFIPADIRFSELAIMKANSQVAARVLSDKGKWMKWFPGESKSTTSNKTNKNIFTFKNYEYTVGNSIMNTMQVSIGNSVKEVKTLITLVPITTDSVIVKWDGEINGGLNPISRIKSYNKAKEIENDMAMILKNLQSFLEKKENAYGFIITEERVADTILISKKYYSNTYPSTADIYYLISDLRKYISSEGAEETNPPMLNIAKEGSNYRTMVAIPVNKILPGKNDFVFKRMISGKILVAEIKGGQYSASQALDQLNLYASDYKLSSPAIPFESLITNRSQEPDTTKWITKIYYPIY